jgi:hypothetical protein
VVLAERFQDTFCSTAGSAAAEFNLSEAAEQLTVSRRRLYDIVNVLEPLQVRDMVSAMDGLRVVYGVQLGSLQGQGVTHT